MKTSTALFICGLSSCLLSNGLAGELKQQGNRFYQHDLKMLHERLNTPINTNKAKNIVILIADGHGVTSHYASRVFSGQKRGKIGEQYWLPQDKFPFSGLVKTYNSNAQTPDSAGTATAIFTGVKTRKGVIGIDDSIPYKDCKNTAKAVVNNVSDIFSQMGKSVGIVTTTNITHATPASVYAHAARRHYESRAARGCDYPDIATQLIDDFKSNRVTIALGGGLQHFIPLRKVTGDPDYGVKGKRRNNLIKTAQQAGVQFTLNHEELPAMVQQPAPILGLFPISDKKREYPKIPSLSHMTEMALKHLKHNKNGYFLAIEAGRVDWKHHDNNLHGALEEADEFANAIATVMNMVDTKDTLVIVTADHSHTLALNGYCGLNTPITGLCYDIDNAGTTHTGEPSKSGDGENYSVAGYLNGHGQYSGALNPNRLKGLTQKEVTDPHYHQSNLFPMNQETHAPEDVAVYAIGPWAHLLSGTIEQSYIFQVMKHASETGD